MTKNKVRGEPVRREKIFIKDTDTRTKDARRKNINIRRRSTTWKKFHTAQNLEVIKSLCRKGWHNDEIAAYIGISESTLYEWTKNIRSFRRHFPLVKTTA